jgi:hypothetical protein
MTTITEIVPDLDTMPDWFREAFEDGTVFSVALATVTELEAKLDDAKKENTRLHNRINEIGAAIRKHGSESLWDQMDGFDADWDILEATRASLRELLGMKEHQG